MKGRLRIGLGLFLLLLGGVGAFLPVWPTTPFVLGAAGCLAGSPRHMRWLRKIRFFREYMDHYKSGSPVSGATLGGSLGFLWGMLILSALLVRRPGVWAVLLAVGLAVTGHLLWIARRRAPAAKKRLDGEFGYDEAEKNHP